MAAMLALKAGAERRAGSNPVLGTIDKGSDGFVG